MHDNVSFVIPHFNNHECLNAVLRRLVQQLEPDDEVIVVDDGSDLAPNYVSDIGCCFFIRSGMGLGFEGTKFWWMIVNGGVFSIATCYI